MRRPPIYWFRLSALISALGAIPLVLGVIQGTEASPWTVAGLMVECVAIIVLNWGTLLHLERRDPKEFARRY